MARATDRTDPKARWKYSVEVERELADRVVKVGRVASTIEMVLGDQRGWSGKGHTFTRSADAAARDLRILLATPGTTDELCAPLQTRGRVSCRNGDLVVLNARRWMEGIEDYQGYLDQYRTYLINHEVGHFLGRGHVSCPGNGLPAPVMMQQTYGLGKCTRNPWP